MDSDDGFAKQGGDALEIGDEFDSEEEHDDKPMQAPTGQASRPTGAQPPKVGGEKVENQPFDLAVDVNDSEEIESDEEEDDQVAALQANSQPTGQQNQASSAS